MLRDLYFVFVERAAIDDVNRSRSVELRVRGSKDEFRIRKNLKEEFKKREKAF